MKRFLRIISLVVVLCMVFTVMTGCAETKQPNADVDKPTDNPVDTPADPAEDADKEPESEKMRLTYVNPIVGHEFMDSITAGAEQAAEDLGGVFDIEVVGPQNAFVADEFVKDFYTAIATKPDGIIGYGYSEELCLTPINEAVAADIPVITVDCDTPSSNRLAYIGTSQYDAGFAAGKKMIELTGGNATIAIISTSLELDALNDRAQGFKDAIKDEAGMTVVVREAAQTLLDSTQKTQQLLLAYPEVNAFFGTDQDSVLGIANTLSEQGIADEYTVIGFDETDDILKAIQEGAIDATVIQQPYEMGYQVVEMFYQLLVEGKEPDQDVYSTPTILATKENVADFMG